MHGPFFTPINESPNIARRDTHQPTMAAAKNITQLLLLSYVCLLLYPSVFAFSKESSSKIIKDINSKGPYIGLIAGSSSVEKAFFATNEFQPDSEHPYVDLSGRRFQVGVAQEKKVIYVRCGTGLVNAAAVTQQLLDLFYMEGIVHFGIAGNTNSSLNIGDVIIPKEFVNTGVWDWLNPEATISSNDFAKLDIKNFNIPKEGSNSLGRIGYSPEEFYSQEGKPNVAQQIVWFNVSSKWLQVASKLEELELARCANPTRCFKNPSLCLKKKPKVVVGLKGSTSNIHVANAAYRDFLFQTIGVSSADMESTAVIMTSISNGYPVIVIRGLANLAGAEEGGQDYSLYGRVTAANVAQAVIKFVYLLYKHQVPESIIECMNN